MQQRVQKAALPEGDRPLPQAGLLFFEHRGETKKIKSLDLIYSGPTGKTTSRSSLSVMSRRFFDNLRPFTVAQALVPAVSTLGRHDTRSALSSSTETLHWCPQAHRPR